MTATPEEIERAFDAWARARFDADAQKTGFVAGFRACEASRPDRMTEANPGAGDLADEIESALAAWPDITVQFAISLPRERWEWLASFLRAQQERSVPEGWRDISTAPKDGTGILVSGGVARWHDGRWCSITGEPYPGRPIEWPVLWWQPLPKAPPPSPVPASPPRESEERRALKEARSWIVRSGAPHIGGIIKQIDNALYPDEALSSETPADDGGEDDKARIARLKKEWADHVPLDDVDHAWLLSRRPEPRSLAPEAGLAEEIERHLSRYAGRITPRTAEHLLMRASEALRPDPASEELLREALEAIRPRINALLPESYKLIRIDRVEPRPFVFEEDEDRTTQPQPAPSAREGK